MRHLRDASKKILDTFDFLPKIMRVSPTYKGPHPKYNSPLPVFEILTQIWIRGVFYLEGLYFQF